MRYAMYVRLGFLGSMLDASFHCMVNLLRELCLAHLPTTPFV